MFEDDGISLGSESYFNYSPPKPSPMVRLSAKIAKSRHDGETQKRQADDAALPFILKDMQDKERAAIQKAQAIEQQITQTQQSLQQPMPTMQAAQMTQAEMIAALVSSLVDPRGTQGYIGTGQQMAGQRAEMDYENQTRQYGIQRQDNQNALEFLQRQLGQQQGIAANYEQMGYTYQQNAERLAQDQSQFDTRERNDLQAVETTQAGLTERAKLNDRTRMFSTLWRGASKDGRREILEKYGYDPDFIAAFNQLTPQEQNLEAKTEGVKLDNKYKDLTLGDRVRSATANADIAELKKIGQEFNNDVLEVRAKYADDKAKAEIRRLNGLADGANKAAASVSARPITSTSWFNASSRYEGAANKNDALAKAYQAEADRYRGRAALIMGADPKEAEKMNKAAAALDAKAAIARANSDAAIETLNSLQEKFGGGVQQPFNPMSGELQGSIGQTSKPAPGKPTNQRRTPPRSVTSGKGKATVKIIRED